LHRIDILVINIPMNDEQFKKILRETMKDERILKPSISAKQDVESNYAHYINMFYKNILYTDCTDLGRTDMCKFKHKLVVGIAQSLVTNDKIIVPIDSADTHVLSRSLRSIEPLQSTDTKCFYKELKNKIIVNSDSLTERLKFMLSPISIDLSDGLKCNMQYVWSDDQLHIKCKKS
jgi:mannitol-1-phosphate/altronate dehydrogenase